MKKEDRENVSDPRAEIDQIDGELLRLLNRRAEIALRVGKAKSDGDASLCDHTREREVLSQVCKQNPGPFDDQSIYSIFQRIIDESLHLQQSTYQKPSSAASGKHTQIQERAASSRIAILGEPGTFSEEAAMAISGGTCETISCPSFDDVFRAIDDGRADLIVAPLENSLIGSIHRCYDLLLESSLTIVGEVDLPISHQLVGCSGSTLDSIGSVESHPAALAQCETFFAAHSHLERIPATDTAGSVKRVVESGDVTRAAIGSRRAAERYGGNILSENIEDHSENFTRFVVLSDNTEAADGEKVSMVMRLKHQPGALHQALRPFVRRGINLLKIESRPVKGSPTEFNFYFDIQVPASESELSAALDEVRTQADQIRILGRYSVIRMASGM